MDMTRARKRRSTFLAICATLCLLQSAICKGQSAIAQEVKWRADYNAARQEAADKGLPLILDFGTQNCFWCKRLDATTFRDANVLKVMNERFVPLKIDANQEPGLTQMLRIQSFPTIVLAAPDGKILGNLEGYMEAPRFLENLQRALTALSNPEWMVRDYQLAAKAVAASDYSRAIALLKSIVEAGGERTIQLKSRQLLGDLEQKAAGRLAEAKQLRDKGKTTEAMDALTEMLRLFAGTRAAAEAGPMLTTLANNVQANNDQRLQRARDLLAQAREDQKAGRYLSCLDRCEVLTTAYADLPQAAEALQIGREIKSNPEWLQATCEDLMNRLGDLYLALADSWVRKGQPQQASVCLQRVVRLFPGSRYAAAAQVRLDQLQPQQPAQLTNFNQK
jgi:thioredoxin-related protein